MNNKEQRRLLVLNEVLAGRLPEKFPQVQLDAFVVMPNHFHAILLLAETEDEAAAAPVTRPQVVQWFKTMTTNDYIKGVASASWAPFPGRLWQRNYDEHIIRNDRSLQAIRQYIKANPSNWIQDELFEPGPA